MFFQFISSAMIFFTVPVTPSLNFLFAHEQHCICQPGKNIGLLQDFWCENYSSVQSIRKHRKQVSVFMDILHFFTTKSNDHHLVQQRKAHKIQNLCDIYFNATDKNHLLSFTLREFRFFHHFWYGSPLLELYFC